MTRTAKDFKSEQSPSSRMNASRIRRLLVSVTSSVFWQLLGPKSHENEGRQGTLDAEVFSGIGFYSRPRTTDKTEAVLASVGDARHSVIIATRNESVRRAIADLQADETAIFTSDGIIVIKADGTIEARSKDGTAQKLVNETYRTAEDTLLTLVKTLATTLASSCPPLGSGLQQAATAAAATALATGVDTFKAAEAAYLTTKLKGE